MNYRLLEKLLKESKFTQTEWAKAAGMTRSGLLNSIENQTLSIKTFENLCKLLDVSAHKFFELSPGKSYNQTNRDLLTVNEDVMKKKNVDEIIMAKDQVIESKEEMIEHLKGQVRFMEKLLSEPPGHEDLDKTKQT